MGFNNLIHSEISKIVEFLSSNPNSYFVNPESAYAVLEKYGVKYEAHDARTNMGVNSTERVATPDRDYSKTAYGSLNWPLFGVVGTMDIKINWSVRNSIITTYYISSVNGRGSNFRPPGYAFGVVRDCFGIYKTDSCSCLDLPWTGSLPNHSQSASLVISNMGTCNVAVAMRFSW